MPDKADIQYAMEHSHVLREPDHRINTFGSTKFHFVILSEMMDCVDKVVVRRGSVEAHKPQIIRPSHYTSVELEGFDENAAELLEWLKKHDKEPVFFQYGFNFKRTEVNSEVITGNFEIVKAEVLKQIQKEDDPMMVLMESVDDTWEIGLLKFSIDIIQKSQEINQFDFKRRGLI